MRKLIVALIAAMTLSGCISSLDSAYDDRARSECDQNARPSDRGDCYDRVDDHRRDRDR